MPRLTVATGSELAAKAGARVAEQGGNAIDAAVAAVLTSMCTEPGIIAPGAGGYISVWPAGGEPVIIDGYAEMPGRGLDTARLGGGRRDIFLGYGGGVDTIVGYGSVATFGAIAGLGLAAERYGTLPWKRLLEPAIEAVEPGFPLSPAAAEYLEFSHDLIFGWDPASRRALHDDEGRPLGAGELVRLPELVDTLHLIAEEGPRSLYEGELAERLSGAILERGGIVTKRDLSEYEAIPRTPVMVELDGWTVATNPPPAVGGVCMAAILLLLDDAHVVEWDAPSVAKLAMIQRNVLDYRKRHLEAAGDRESHAVALLDLAARGELESLRGSASTTHTSAADAAGNVCSITVSAGYGSGAMVPGTGFWLNNSLGELELHPSGYHGLQPGTRLISNMAPTVARHISGASLAIGSPGADRITTAISTVLYNYTKLGMSLDEAISAPRGHAEVFEGEPRFAHEPGIDVSGVEFSPRPFPSVSMFFGGVQATVHQADDSLYAAADPRRAGSIAFGTPPPAQ